MFELFCATSCTVEWLGKQSFKNWERFGFNYFQVNCVLLNVVIIEKQKFSKKSVLISSDENKNEIVSTSGKDTDYKFLSTWCSVE